MNIIYGDGPIIRSANSSELEQITLEATPLPVITEPGSGSDATVLDEIVTTHPSAGYYRNYAINHTAPDGLIQSLENLDEAVASLEGGMLTRITDGVARIRLRTRWGIKGLDLNVSEVDGGSTQTRVFAPGTLTKHINDQVLDRIDGLTPSVAKPMFSLMDHTTGSFIWNTECWLAGIDLTCISPSNIQYGPRRAGIAISPRHVYFVRHYPLTVGTVVRFVTTANETIERTIIAVADDGTNPWQNEVVVGLLDSDLPSSITPCKVVPKNWLDYAPNAARGLLVVHTDQEKKGLISQVRYIHPTNVQLGVPIISEEAAAYYEDMIPGDSGSPGGILINDEFVLVGGQVDDVAYHHDLINALMTSLGGGYQLTEYDLASQFPRFAGEDFTSRNQTFFTAHYDASDEDSVTIDTGVSEIVDQRGNYNATQATGASQPSLVDWGNGLKCLSFDGTTDFMELPNIPQADAKWCLAVVDTTDLQTSYRALAGRTSPSNPPALYLGMGYTGGSYRPGIYQDSGDTAPYPVVLRSKGLVEWSIGDPTFTRVNDSIVIPTGSAPGTLSSWNLLGGNTAVSQLSQVKVAELVFAPFEPGANLRQWLLDYLIAKWGIVKQLRFDGLSDHIDTGVTMDGWTEFTILLDVKWLSMSGYDVEGWYQSGSNLVRIGRSNGRRPWFDWGAGNRHPAGPTLSENTRYTLVGTSKSGGNAILYVDGTPVDTTAVGAYTLSNTTRPYWVGANNQGNSTANDIAHQTLYRHQIFDRQLTAAEVEFFHSKGASGDDPGPAVWSLF